MKVLLIVFFLVPALAWSQQSLKLSSPDKKLELTVGFGDSLSFELSGPGGKLLERSLIGMTLENKVVWGARPRLLSKHYSSIDSRFPSPFYIKSSVREQYNELRLTFAGGYGLDLRAYNEGAAYRFTSSRSGPYKVLAEQADYQLAATDSVVAAYVKGDKNDRFINSFENTYSFLTAAGVPGEQLLLTPALIRKAYPASVLITESNLKSYPGMYLAKSDRKPGTLKAVFAPCPIGESVTEDVQEIHVKGRHTYLAAVNSPRVFPWRLFAVASDEKDLLANDLAYLLAGHSVLAELSWIKPGKASWDWWAAWNLGGVNFRAGVNDSTYRYHIDFASKNKLEYILLDAGWYTGFDVMQTVQKIDLPGLIRYGNSKNVGIWLWLGSSRLYGREEEVIAHYAGLGVKGFKIDFFDRDDQLSVDYIYKLLAIAASHHLMLDLHGVFKPCGMQREYPNLVGMEGVFGLENLKWTHYDDFPVHLTTLPFTRMVAGMMDFTPGAMRNATKEDYYPVSDRPMSQGTRCQQLALYVLDYVPFQMLADDPATYAKEQECTTFISRFPTVWDSTVALSGRAGKYVALARKKGKNWYSGIMTNWEPRDLALDCSFLGTGQFSAEIFQDGVNADRRADDYQRRVIPVTRDSKIPVHLAPGGGWAAVYTAQ